MPFHADRSASFSYSPMLKLSPPIVVDKAYGILLRLPFRLEVASGAAVRTPASPLSVYLSLSRVLALLPVSRETYFPIAYPRKVFYVPFRFSAP